MPEIKKVSVKHEAIMDYLLANPGEKLGVVAAHFHVSQAWLSTIIHSDAFRTRMEQKQERAFDETIIPLREKVLGIAHLGVEKLGEAMENASPMSDRDFIADTTDNILKNLGYSPKSAPPQTQQVGAQQNNYYVVDSASLAEARARMRQAPLTIPAESEVPAIDQKEGGPTEGV